MRYVNQSGRVIGLLGLCLMLGLTAGCNKMLAKYNVNKAQERVDEAVNKYDAPRFTQAQLEQATNLITEANSSIGTEQFDAARDSAKQAADLSKELLLQTKIQKANSMKEEAYFWLDKAKLNDATAIDAAQIQQITADNEKGLELIGKEKWEKSIEVFTKVVTDIKFLLGNLEKDSRRGLEEARNGKAELIQEGAPEHAPEYIEQIDNQIQEIENLIEKEYSYRQALTVIALARQKKDEGITATKQVKSQKIITQIENMLEEASDLGADLYAQESLRIITKDFETLLNTFYDKRYDTVLSSAPQLQPRVADLILETKRNGAKSMIDSVTQAINTLTDGKARVYLPGSVEQLDALQAEAQGLFDQENYVESKVVSQRGLELKEKIRLDFDNLAEEQINKAQDELAKAEGVFGQMEEIFTNQIPGQWVGSEKALEDSKQALKEELRARLNNAKLSLGVAQLKREGELFSVSIETAKSVAEASDFVQQQTYRVVAHNAVLVIANQLTEYEKGPGRSYAPKEMDKAEAMLEETKGLLHQDDYRAAVRRASDTKAQMDIVSQELNRVAVDRIGQAQTALETARKDRAADFESDAFNQAMVTIDEARTALQGDNKQLAIESAIQAANIAREASNQALRQWTEDYLAQSAEWLNKAVTAGAERYAPDQLEEAVAKQKTIQQLYDQGSYAESVALGPETVQASHDALYALIIRADNGIAAARQFGAFDYEPDRLTNAIVSLKQAREKLEAGDYKTAELHAYNAINLGGKLQVEARRSAFAYQVAQLNARLAKAEQQGTGLFQINDVAAVLGELQSLQNQFDPRDFDDYAKQVEQLEAQLASMVERTPDVLNNLVVRMQDEMTRLNSRGADDFLPNLMTEAANKVKFAQLDFNNGKYHSSYQNMRDAGQILGEVKQHMDERDYDTELNELVGDFAAALHNFRHVLDLGSATMLRMSLGAQGAARSVAILQATNPTDLRNTLTDLMSRARRLTPPPTRVNQAQALMQMLNVAATATANFEKMLILDQYSPADARDIIQAAYSQMLTAQKMQQQVQHAVKYPRSRFEPRGVEKVVSLSERK